jgi:pimeloyl-ACP methyl ester carboxylesterase
VQRVLRQNRVKHMGGTAVVGGETVRYDLCSVDARSAAQRAEDECRGRPAGPVIVVVPGHGQTVDGPRKLVAAAALFSRSKIAWCIDPAPCRGGDCTEARAIAAIARQKLSAEFPHPDDPDRPVQAVLIGWSHGGSEALRAAAADPDLFPCFVGLCSTGFVERRLLGMLLGFCLETLRIIGRCICRRRWQYLRDTMRLGADLAVGLVRDLWHGHSLVKLVQDVVWATRRVVGPTFPYTGWALLVWGRQDTVVRWRDVFPDCTDPEEIPGSLARFQAENLPRARRVEVAVIDGDHVGPEADAIDFVRLGLSGVHQLDGVTDERL